MNQITHTINKAVNHEIWRKNYPYYSKRNISLKLFDIIWDKIIDKVGDMVIEVRSKSEVASVIYDKLFR